MRHHHKYYTPIIIINQQKPLIPKSIIYRLSFEIQHGDAMRKRFFKIFQQRTTMMSFSLSIFLAIMLILCVTMTHSSSQQSQSLFEIDHL